MSDKNTQTLAVCNQKGGVGKTATTFHLCRAAVLAGHRVLVVDADPQGSLTSVIARDAVGEDQAGLADVLSQRSGDTISDVIIPGIWDGVDVVPTAPSEALAYVSDELIVAGAGRERRLYDALKAVAGEYDLILIDCPPSLDQLTINGLTAAEGIVIVTEPSLFSANGLARLLSTIDSVRGAYNSELTIAGIIINRLEKGTLSGREWVATLTEAAAARGLDILDPPLPKAVAIKDASEAARGLDEYGTTAARELFEIYRGYLAALTERTTK